MAWLTKIETRLGLHPRRFVHALLDGSYASRVAGRSLEFNDLRGYVRGDDVKDIDWKASARSGELLVKRYVAQRRHTLLVVMPASPDLAAAASPDASKAEVALLAVGMLGYLASRHGDYVSLVTPGPDGPTIARPSSRGVDLERMLSEAEERCTPEAETADLVDLLELATTAVRRRCIAVVVLDDWQPDQDTRHALQRLASRHETLALCLNDIDVTSSALRGRRVVAMRSRRRVPSFVAADPTLARQVAAQRERRRQERHDELTRMGILHVELEGPDDVVPGIITLLEEMRHAARR